MNYGRGVWYEIWRGVGCMKFCGGGGRIMEGGGYDYGRGCSESMSVCDGIQLSVCVVTSQHVWWW